MSMRTLAGHQGTLNPLAAPTINANPLAAPEGANPLAATVGAIPLAEPSTNTQNPLEATDSGADKRKRQWRCIVQDGETWFQCEDESVESKFSLDDGDELLGKRWRKLLDEESKEKYYECIDDDVIECKWELTEGDEEVVDEVVE